MPHCVLAMQNWQQQPSKQLVSMLKWLFQEVAKMHARKDTHGNVNPKTISCHPESGWVLAPPAPAPHAQTSSLADLAQRQKADAVQIARLSCFMCLSFEHRRQYQPHHLPDLTDEQLLGLVDNVPDIRLLAAALLRGSVTLAEAMSFHIWHPVAMHAQVAPLTPVLSLAVAVLRGVSLAAVPLPFGLQCRLLLPGWRKVLVGYRGCVMQVLQDTKAVMRSMRLGSEDFDSLYNGVILGGTSWCDALGGTLIPAVVAASREHVLRADFAAYDFNSAGSLLRFAANTVGHFEELALGLQVTKAAFLDTIVTTFPALVPACYHYLATYPSLHMCNRDCTLVRPPPPPCPAPPPCVKLPFAPASPAWCFSLLP
jgi:hypothetical protein